MHLNSSFFKNLLILALVIFLTACGKDDGTTPPAEGDKSLNLGSVGSSANDLLSEANYSSIVVEIQYAAGFPPPQASINYLREFLNARLNKPGGITINLVEVAAPRQATYSLSELRGIEDEQRTEFTSGSKIAAYFYFADGDYAENSNVLGVAHRNTSMVIFQKRIEELSGGVGQVSTSLLTSSVMGHEFAHILGLVNIGSPMQNAHQDDANGAHCDNQDCLMYFAVENSSGLSDLLGMSSPPPLDANCLADLSANGGK